MHKDLLEDSSRSSSFSKANSFKHCASYTRNYVLLLGLECTLSHTHNIYKYNNYKLSIYNNHYYNQV